jgi:hypothetical protein
MLHGMYFAVKMDILFGTKEDGLKGWLVERVGCSSTAGWRANDVGRRRRGLRLGL